MHNGARSWSERGATLLEYILLAALIVVVCIAGMTAVGESANSKLQIPITDAVTGTPDTPDIIE